MDIVFIIFSGQISKFIFFIIFLLIGNGSYTNNLSTLFPDQFGRNCPQDKLTSQARSIHFFWTIYPQSHLEKVYLDNRIHYLLWKLWFLRTGQLSKKLHDSVKYQLNKFYIFSRNCNAPSNKIRSTFQPLKLLGNIAIFKGATALFQKVNIALNSLCQPQRAQKKKQFFL